jgi:uncharacterized RDD family membrane protein YckC
MQYTPATKIARLGAVLIDTLIGLVLSIPIFFIFGLWGAVIHNQLSFMAKLGLGIFGFVTFLLVHGFLLKTKGQTIGKKLVGIRIADMDGNLPDIKKIVLLRYLPLQLCNMVPYVGMLAGLIDALFIFSSDRRCVHDLIAGTQVLNVDERK